MFPSHAAACISNVPTHSLSSIEQEQRLPSALQYPLIDTCIRLTSGREQTDAKRAVTTTPSGYSSSIGVETTLHAMLSGKPNMIKKALMILCRSNRNVLWHNQGSMRFRRLGSFASFGLALACLQRQPVRVGGKAEHDVCQQRSDDHATRPLPTATLWMKPSYPKQGQRSL